MELLTVQTFKDIEARHGGVVARLCARNYLAGAAGLLNADAVSVKYSTAYRDLHAFAYPAASCGVCAGWTSYGGMSQFSNTQQGCDCRGHIDSKRT